MTLKEARDSVGRCVAYTTSHGATELGRITSVGTKFVFVRYEGDIHSKATAPENLSLVGAR